MAETATIASHIGPGLKSQPGCNFFSLICVRIHTNEFIQQLYKLYSTNSYTVWFLYQFIHFLYKLYSTNSYKIFNFFSTSAQAASVQREPRGAKPEHTSCPDQAAPGCPDLQGTPGCPDQLGCVRGGVGLEMGLRCTICITGAPTVRVHPGAPTFRVHPSEK